MSKKKLIKPDGAEWGRNLWQSLYGIMSYSLFVPDVGIVANVWCNSSGWYGDNGLNPGNCQWAGATREEVQTLVMHGLADNNLYGFGWGEPEYWAYELRAYRMCGGLSIRNPRTLTHAREIFTDCTLEENVTHAVLLGINEDLTSEELDRYQKEGESDV